MKVVLWLLGGLVGLVVLAVLVLFCMGLAPGAGDTRVAVEIARPPEEVWTWITEEAKVKKWVSWLVEIREDTHGIEGVGARETWIMDDPTMKQRLEIPSLVTSYDKPRRVGVRIAAPKMFTGDVTYTLTPTATGTRLEQYGRWHYDDAFARLMVPLITPQANAKGKADFGRLKALIEAR
jgi:uncharacterized protein YndB with AHSA1/START domain